MRVDLCLCAEIPTIELATRLLVVITRTELLTPTNTGRLATLALPNSEIVIRGGLDVAYDLAPRLRPGRQALLLYPSADARVLDAELVASYGGAVDLVVPDGNWRQTSKMCRRCPTMASLPRVILAPGAPTAYGVRKESKSEGMATIEAIARALAVIERPEVGDALEALLQVMVRRTLWSRGVLRADALPEFRGV
jgi:DTW domain-containing protein YfiP